MSVRDIVYRLNPITRAPNTIIETLFPLWANVDFQFINRENAVVLIPRVRAQDNAVKRYLFRAPTRDAHAVVNDALPRTRLEYLVLLFWS